MNLIANPWFWLGALLVVLGALGAGTRIGQKLSANELKDYKLEVQAKDLAREKAATAKNRQHEIALNAADSALQKAKKENADQKAADAKRVAAGDLRVFIPARGSEPASAAPGSGVRNAAAVCELPSSFVGALLDLANDADSVASQLYACQQVVISDRLETP